MEKLLHNITLQEAQQVARKCCRIQKDQNIDQPLNIRLKFYISGKRHYHARLVNLPCPVETHRTFDKITMYKTGNIGQMIIVLMIIMFITLRGHREFYILKNQKNI